jgi:hypothetical protein
MEERKMVFLPNRTNADPDDVRAKVEVGVCKYRIGTGSWDLVDEASRDSFPASDAPPWTLGYLEPPARAAQACGDAKESGPV